MTLTPLSTITAGALGGGLIPPQASDAAAEVDRSMLILLGLTGLILLIVATLVGYFSLRYREGASRPRHALSLRSTPVETAWGAALMLGAVALFGLGAARMLRPREQPGGGQTVYIVGKQWMWKVQHPDGRREINELHLPLGEPVRLLMTSQDVIHSFYVPAFRLKQDVLPDRFTTLAFTPTRAGVYRLLCAEYCGSKHAAMDGVVVVMPPDEYQRWLSPGAEEAGARPFLSLAAEGAEVFNALGCGACHTREMTPMAPVLAGLFGRQTRLRTGELVLADENYIRESVLRPNAKIVAGYPFPTDMPSYQGQISEEQLVQLVEFIRSIQHGWPEEGEEGAP